MVFCQYLISLCDYPIISKNNEVYSEYFEEILLINLKIKITYKSFSLIHYLRIVNFFYFY